MNKLAELIEHNGSRLPVQLHIMYRFTIYDLMRKHRHRKMYRHCENAYNNNQNKFMH